MLQKDPFVLDGNVLKINKWNEFSKHVIAGFSTKRGGHSCAPYTSLNLGLHVDDKIEDVLSNRHTLSNIVGFNTSNWVCSNQVHDNKITKVSLNDMGKGVYSLENSIEDSDGLYTFDSNILLTLCFADCVPVYFFSPSYHAIGVAHAGWKGTVKDIAGEMIRLWTRNEKIPHSEIFTAIGPSIGSCCYIVDDRVIENVNKVLVDHPESTYKEVDIGQYSLNLNQLNEKLLLQSGIPKENILISHYCTSCEDELFFSHRRDKGHTGRMMSFIGFKED
ncbi:peptidoglycan editing factor PgeF [Bacillus timonensis]|nr:peptidoglycan editing factor PgeF [Bacillus timonensis]